MMVGSVVGVICGVVCLIVLGFWWFNHQLEPVNPGSVENVTVIIPKGASSSTVARLLYEKKLIADAQIFALYARQQDLNSVLQPGSYELSPGMSAEEILAVIKAGAKDVWVTIPEGLRVEEVASIFAQKKLPEFDETQFLALAAKNEGRLFPDTYLVPKLVTAEQVFDVLNNTFHTKVEQALATEIEASGKTLEEILVIASLVQREGRSKRDMAMIAGILDNRLKIGMKLDIDATLSYLRGFDPVAKSWWSAPHPSLKQSVSPFNTYMVAGLPPAPIANPGLDAIEATLQPTQSEYLFYLHAPDGQAYYAQTLAQHNANIDRYLR